MKLYPILASISEASQKWSAGVSSIECELDDLQYLVNALAVEGTSVCGGIFVDE